MSQISSAAASHASSATILHAALVTVWNLLIQVPVRTTAQPPAAHAGHTVARRESPRQIVLPVLHLATLTQNVLLTSLQANSVGTPQLGSGGDGSHDGDSGWFDCDGAVGGSGDDGAVGSGPGDDGAMGSGPGDDGAVGSGPGDDGAMGAGPVGDGAMGAGRVSDGAVGAGRVRDGAVGAGTVGDGTIGVNDVGETNVGAVGVEGDGFIGVVMLNNVGDDVGDDVGADVGPGESNDVFWSERPGGILMSSFSSSRGMFT